MLLLLLYWCYLGIVFLNFGFAFQKITRLKVNDTIFSIVFGMFATTLMASTWAIFGRINIEFQIFLLALQCLILITRRNELYAVYHDFWLQITGLPQKLKILFALTILLTLLYAVSDATFIDNETYYVQTIQWLNEYGFVKGLANLHLFLGQTSGWHILQSAFSFSYLSDRLNHLNGFCLLLGNLFALFRLNDYFKSKKPQQLWIGLLPVANIVLFLYCNVPSPGLAVSVLSLMLFYYFIDQFKKADRETFSVLLLLAVFIVYIKITALPLVLLPFIFLWIHFKKIISKITLGSVIGFLVLLLFIIKNVILTGYPLFPSPLFKSYCHVNYSIPMAFYDFSFDRAHCYSFFISGKDYAASNGLAIFLKWLTSNIYNGLIAILLLQIPYFLYRFLNQRNYWILYSVMVFQLGYMWYSSPQYRFMIPFILLFGLLMLSVFSHQEKPIYLTLFGCFSLTFLLLLFPPKLGRNQEKMIFNKRSFTYHQLIYPNKNSNLKTTYHPSKIGNLKYFSPDGSVYIWANGSGKLPCVNVKQIDYFNRKLHHIPQLRTAEIKDGFYSQKTNP